ncbi:hypothetical protein M2263_001754 [Providencia alcalifaciens]|nr:hypothetical protein [Providencia alcalifaciens]
MMKFKVCDKVKLKQSSKHIVLKDKVFTATYFHSLYIFCDLDGIEYSFRPYFLELINE